MRRRAFIAGLGAAAALPRAAYAQPTNLPIVGFLHSASPERYGSRLAAFREGLKEAGFTESQNVTIEYRWADGHYDRLPALAAELVQAQVEVIAAASTPAAVAAKAATTTIPIVFTTANDPVELGLVKSLHRPGGNITGSVNMGVELAPKRLELLHQIVPAATVMALLVNPAGPSAKAVTRQTQAAARTLGMELHVLPVSTERDIEKAFAKVAQLRAGGVVIGSDPLLNRQSHELAALMLRHKVPTISPYGEFTAAGGLVAYSGSSISSYHAAGVFTGRILKGEKPADLPVQQSTKIELMINLKAAKALGLTFPLSLLARADEVIE
jgi:putative tryptophan/tyrosine transport system substrate-binding protein